MRDLIIKVRMVRLDGEKKAKPYIMTASNRVYPITRKQYKLLKYAQGNAYIIDEE